MNKLKTELINIWKEVFHDDDEYIRLIYDNYFFPECIEFIRNNNKIAAALTGIPYRFNCSVVDNSCHYDAVSHTKSSLNGIYLCGLSTLPAFRKRGLMSKLISNSIVNSHNKGFDFSFLIPADDKLREYYRKHDYIDVSFRGKYLLYSESQISPSVVENDSIDTLNYYPLNINYRFNNYALCEMCVDSDLYKLLKYISRYCVDSKGNIFDNCSIDYCINKYFKQCVKLQQYNDNNLVYIYNTLDSNDKYILLLNLNYIINNIICLYKLFKSNNDNKYANPILRINHTFSDYINVLYENHISGNSIVLLYNANNSFIVSGNNTMKYAHIFEKLNYKFRFDEYLKPLVTPIECLSKDDLFVKNLKYCEPLAMLFCSNIRCNDVTIWTLLSESEDSEMVALELLKSVLYNSPSLTYYRNEISKESSVRFRSRAVLSSAWTGVEEKLIPYIMMRPLNLPYILKFLADRTSLGKFSILVKDDLIAENDGLYMSENGTFSFTPSVNLSESDIYQLRESMVKTCSKPFFTPSELVACLCYNPLNFSLKTASNVVFEIRRLTASDNLFSAFSFDAFLLLD